MEAISPPIMLCPPQEERIHSVDKKYILRWVKVCVKPAFPLDLVV